MVRIRYRLEDLYPASVVEKVLDTLQQPDISGKMREALERVGVRDVNPVEHMQHAFRQARSWFDSFTRGDDLTGRQASLINATGSMFADAKVGIPISTAVAHTYAKASVEYQDVGLAAAAANAMARKLLGQVTISWHLSVADALARLLSSKRILIAKRDLIRIPGVGDIGLILSGLDTLEVGATNGCTPEDWQQAVDMASQSPVGGKPAEATGAGVLLIRPNGMPPESAETHRQAAIDAARGKGIPVFELVADGVVSPRLAEAFGFSDVRRCLQGEADVVIAPMHFLVGAPRGCIVFGAERIDASLHREASLSGTHLSAPELLAAVAAFQLGESDRPEDGPAAALLANPQNLRNRAERLALQVRAHAAVREAVVRERTVPLGPPPWDIYQLTNVAIELSLEGDARQLQETLRSPEASQPTEEGNQSDHAPHISIASALEDDRLLLDLRFVEPKHDHLIALAFAPQLSSAEPTET